MKSIKKIGLVLCGIVLFSGCITGAQAAQETTQDEITLGGRAEPFQEVVVSPSIEGKIKNILTELGTYVKQGDKLAELDDGDLAIQLKQAEDQVKVVEAQGNLTAMEQQIALSQTMASLNQGVTALPPEPPQMPEMSGFPEVEAAKIAVQDAELAFSEITKEWEDTNELFKNGLVSQQELHQVTNAKDSAQIALERAKKKVQTETEKASVQQKYEQEMKEYKKELAQFEKQLNQASDQTQKSANDTLSLQKESSQVTSTMTKIAIENAKINLEAVRSQFEKLQITAPVNGFITVKDGRIGEVASPGNPLFIITNLDQLYITIDVPEAMINKWQVNQKVSVRIPTQNIVKEGKVVYVGLMPNGGEATYPVKVIIENNDHKIRGGMQAVVTWKNEEVKNEPQENDNN